ncbi:mitochondrial carrier protein MTM1-like isoform X2 [Neltuma alba]|uniref:mitochondrial carrier protein MTM1-like isoform X2 n=1 Tax=Neltuma alba TaxID=207710 RepID=UPI0010A4CAAF|nr:mitochondrial carrier protein MTM1-like isoform X2 [Prosopis alba]
MVGSKQGFPSWIGAAATRVDFEGKVSSMSSSSDPSDHHSGSSGAPPPSHSDAELSFGERALSAAGAAFVSAIIVNPLDVAKTRLQAQAAGVSYQNICRMGCETNTRVPDARYPVMQAFSKSESACPLGCHANQYRGTLDVLYKVIRQEGFTRLWRGTNASLALAVPSVGIYMPCYDIFRNMMDDFTTQNAPNLTPYVPLVAGTLSRSLACISCYPVELARTRMQAFRATQKGMLPGVWKTLLGVIKPLNGASLLQNLHGYRFWWTGLGAQLARDVPFSAICWPTLEPIRRRLLGLAGDEASVATILGANFSAGFAAGTLAAAATCPLDVAKTRRQIEDPERALKMTTRTTLLEIWRDGGLRGLFTGVGPRLGRAGPSVGIVVSFYEVVKYTIYYRHHTSS